jgi:hypothetical protein
MKWNPAMKSKMVFLGIILILLGAITTYFHDYTIESQPTINFKEVGNQWSLVKEFTENETSKNTVIGLDFRYANDWTLPMFEFEPVELPPGSNQTYKDVKFLDVNLTSPIGNYTAFRFFLILYQSMMVVFPDYIQVLNQNGGIKVDEGYPKAETQKGETIYYLGKVEHAGVYNITLSLDYMIEDEKVVGPASMKFDWFIVKDSLGKSLFADYFSDADETNSTWRIRTPNNSNLTNPWTAANGIYNYYSSTSDYEGVQTTYVGNSTWNDYTIEVNASYVSGAYGPNIIARLNETSGERYAFGVYPNKDAEGPNKVRLLKFKGWNRSPTILAEAQVTTDTKWHILKIELNGPNIKCYYDGSMVINVSDSSYSSGLAGLETTVRFSLPWQHSPSPPPTIKIYSITSEIFHPYSSFLYAGPAIAIAGTVVTIRGYLSERSKKRRLRKK